MRQRRKFSEEFKREAVGLTRLPDANISQIAQDLGIGSNLLWRWRRELASGAKKPFPGAGVARDEEVRALKRELPRVRAEPDFLRAASTLAAKKKN